MTTKKTTIKSKEAPKKTEKEPFYWDEEILIASTMVSEKQQMTVRLCKKNDKGYITLVKNIKTKTGMKPVKGFTIPYHSAQQISALINRAYNEGNKMQFDKTTDDTIL